MPPTPSPVVSLTVDPAMVEGIVKKEIQAAIVAQLGKAPDLIEQVARGALAMKVSKNGTVSGYSYENTYDLVSALTQVAIAEAAQLAVKEWIAENKPTIVAAVGKVLRANKNKLVQTYISAVENSLVPSMYVSVNLNLKEQV